MAGSDLKGAASPPAATHPLGRTHRRPRAVHPQTCCPSEQAGDDRAAKRVANGKAPSPWSRARKLPPLVFPHAAVMEAKTRDSRCCSSLRVSDLSEFFAVAEKDGHVMADVIGDRCLDCREWRDCSHVKSRFNSTDNSKRRVSTHLFWKRLLGVSFPVTDAMLQQHVWKKLPSCEFGIKYVPDGMSVRSPSVATHAPSPSGHGISPSRPLSVNNSDESTI